MSLVEKVARVINAELLPYGVSKEYALKAARAAIEAMREPTGEMCRAGGENVFNERMGAFPEKDAEDAANIFRTMIDAALK